MRYCMECGTVAEEGELATCPACGRILSSLDDLAPEDLDRPVVLTFCRDLYEAVVLRTVLAQEDIPSLIEDEQLFAAAGAYPLGHGGAVRQPRVMVRLEDAEAALDLLRRKEAGELAIDEDDFLETEVDEDESP